MLSSAAVSSPAIGATNHSLEDLLPLSLVREHIADDDTERFSEAQLGLYREAAFEACELYVGYPLNRGMRQEQEELDLPRGFSLRATPSNGGFHRLRYPATTGIVHVTSDFGSQEVRIAIGGTRLPLWLLNETINFGGATCDPFAVNVPRQTFTAVYMTGDQHARPLPSGLKLGMLKFIAWSVTNAGDTVVTVTGSISSSRDTQVTFGTNNAAVASGAVDQWRQYARNLVR